VPRTKTLKEVREKYSTLEIDVASGDIESLTGRIIFKRDTGKLCFATLREGDGTELQAMFSLDKIGQESIDSWKSDIDLGDIVSVTGEIITSKRGELSILANSWKLASKSLRPLPNDHKPMSEETRVRMRYVDLIVRPEARENARLRPAVMRSLRETFHDQNFIEVETPMLQVMHGGATARPFKSFSNAYDMDLYLRIAPELFLKRCVVGGIERVFEINRNFRNEGISRKHNPEFTMLEAYWAYSDFEGMAGLVEEMISGAAQELTGGLQVQQSDGSVIDFARPWPRKRYRDAVVEVAGADWFQLSKEEMEKKARALGLELEPNLAPADITQKVFEKKVEGQAVNPIFITHLPAELVPLAKLNREDPTVVDVFELLLGRQEVSPGYSELNDPLLQAERFRKQVGEHTQKVDEDFLEALQSGMPPAGGMGLGVDRLAMLLSGSDSIREVILFPLLRPRETSA
jgi:lysyl-tRNA synthetase class 2